MIDMTWVEDQLQFWFGASFKAVTNNEWDTLTEMLQSTKYGKHVHDFLAPDDLSEEKVAAKYNGFGAYRFQWDADILQDILRHDKDGSIQDDHRFPILMVDCIGPKAPLIAYNRIPHTHTILWPLPYHWNESKKGLYDTLPFDYKKGGVIIFRGAQSGPFENICIEGREKLSRLQFVMQWNTQPWTDFGIAFVPKAVRDHHRDFKTFESKLDHCMSKPMPIDEQMKYKYIVCLEGADISSSFGWVLASNSVPFHPYPFTYEAWFFNGLEPFVHFIPIKPDGSDLEAKFRWCERNPDFCRDISRNGKEHMERMLNEEWISCVKDRFVKKWNMKSSIKNTDIIYNSCK